ncbi:hypothetical protein HNP84_002554 [Thermocatellispora tengchongensis]|uniref:DUF2071 domain-containing protein n=1 Tax=Thermocatellispora tengchongensis TaxID=1073253 RepID=A0A840P4K3_9ACTN|nr:DUF2071 domain-containing protein [Thermocatellispora tengchongensis]MBB5132833.1 hypothetical protein [Thermocatellispora tengchongensis]
MSFQGTARPRARWHHARTDLDDFAIISYRVEPGALAGRLPPGFEPVVRAFADGRTGALVSAVAFRDRDFHFRFCPPAAISCGQINYRAYVTGRDGESGVWFFGTELDHPLVAIPRHVWGMPWRRSRIAIEAEWDGEVRWRLESGRARCEAVGVAARELDGFAGEGEWLPLLTHPTVGWYLRRDGRVGTYSIWHPPMRAVHLEAGSARFAVFEGLGLVGAGDRPHSILAQRSIPFDIHTPPRPALFTKRLL